MSKPAGAQPLSYLNQLNEFIPREVLFGNPDKTGVQISPDGLKMSWLASDSKGVLNVFIKDIAGAELKQVTKDEKRGIRNYGWTYDNRK
ncbi:MAG TPA: S9 family peptidase, partial [bacterium]|nr:S9 family peptidase [bacterium]